MALGAQRSQVLALIFRGGFRLVSLGLVVGLAGALALSRVLGAFLFGVQAIDPLVYAAVAALFVVIAGVACWLPSWRATKVDPMAALRAE